jgi:hypothetical protein
MASTCSRALSSWTNRLQVSSENYPNWHLFI